MNLPNKVKHVTYCFDKDISETSVRGPFSDTIFELFEQHLIVGHNNLNFTENRLALIGSNNSVGLKRDQIDLKSNDYSSIAIFSNRRELTSTTLRKPST